jgi:hypothetical protein
MRSEGISIQRNLDPEQFLEEQAAAPQVWARRAARENLAEIASRKVDSHRFRALLEAFAACPRLT